jgi:hypothetical protein
MVVMNNFVFTFIVNLAYLLCLALRDPVGALCTPAGLECGLNDTPKQGIGANSDCEIAPPKNLDTEIVLIIN